MKRATAIPDSHRDLLEAPCFAQLACTTTDGRLSNNTVALVCDGERIRFSTVRSRQKYRNLAADPRVALLVPDPENPWRYLELRGRVELEVDADRRFIDSLARLYMDREHYPFDRPGDERITCTLVIDQVRAEQILTDVGHPSRLRES